jgi:hypothetical protein
MNHIWNQLALGQTHLFLECPFFALFWEARIEKVLEVRPQSLCNELVRPRPLDPILPHIPPKTPHFTPRILGFFLILLFVLFIRLGCAREQAMRPLCPYSALTRAPGLALRRWRNESVKVILDDRMTERLAGVEIGILVIPIPRGRVCR